MTQTVYCRDSAGIVHATATVSWTTGPEVTVNVTYLESNSWRIKPQGANTNPVLSVTNGGTTGTFDAADGQTYVFQSVIAGSWANSYDGSSNFTVDFGGDDGGNTGGDTGGSTGGGIGGGYGDDTTYYLYVKASEGVSISVNRTSAGRPDLGGYSGELVDGVEYQDDEGLWLRYGIWTGDWFKISVDAQEGYALSSNDIRGLIYDGSYAKWRFDGTEATEARIIATASPGSTDDGRYIIGNSYKTATYRAYKYKDGNWGPLEAVGSVMRATGTVRTAVDEVFVPCGFSPDLVVLSLGEKENENDVDYNLSATAAFDADNAKYESLALWSYEYDEDLYLYVTKHDNGFYLVVWYSDSGSMTSVEAEFSYTAIKYT